VTHSGGNVVSFDQRHTSVATDFSMGFGEILSAMAATLPQANSLGYSQTVFTLTQNVPYNFGLVTQLLNEIYQYETFNTGSVRNIYSPNVTTATELMVDQAAKAMGKDPYQFRRAFVRDRSPAGRAGQRRQGRELGAGDGSRNGPGHRDPQGVQERRRLSGRDRLQVSGGQSPDHGRLHRAAGHQGGMRRRRRSRDQPPRAPGPDDAG
jgi:hypothetical protein